jgi:hypothetical protein
MSSEMMEFAVALMGLLFAMAGTFFAARRAFDF